MVLGRFFTVGLACALLHNAIMICGDWLGLHYSASSLLSFAIVSIFGYRLHSGWTFRGAQRGSIPFARYAVTMSANLPLSLAGMFVLVDLAGLPVVVAAPLATLVLAAFNFAGARWALKTYRARHRTG